MPNSVQSESDQILLIGKDGASVPFSLSVLLAVSPLLRDTLRDTVCLCSTNISFPFVDFDILCLVAEILRQGESTCVMPLKEASTCVVKAQAVIDQLQIDACIGLNRSSGRVGSLLISNIESKTDIWSALTDSKMSESLNNNEIPGKMCYTCSFCWKDFESKMKMYKHVKLEHPETTHGCTSCGSRFIHQNNLDNHIRNAHPTNDQLTRQSEVDIKAENGPDQNESMDKSCKLLKKFFPCDFCEKVFTQLTTNLVTPDIMEKYCLKWNEFEANIRESFRKLREEERFFDVTLASDDGQRIQAHKMSSFFNDIFMKNDHKNMLIYLKGINSTELEQVTDFLYNGEAFITQEELNMFLDTAKDLKVKGLLGDLQGIGQNEPNKSMYQHNNEFIGKESECESEDSIAEESIVKESIIDSLEEQDESCRFTKDDIFDSVKENRLALNTNNQLDLQIEQMIEKNEGLWKCKVCGRTAANKAHTRRHAETHIEGISIVCHICNKTLSTRKGAREHISRGHCKNHQKRHCLDVNVKKGKRVHNLSKGEKGKRKISRKTKILFQGKIKDEESSKQLAISGSGQVEKFKCSECQKVFSTVKNLKIHKSKSAHCF